MALYVYDSTISKSVKDYSKLIDLITKFIAHRGGMLFAALFSEFWNPIVDKDAKVFETCMDQK